MKRISLILSAAICFAAFSARAANPATSDSLTMSDFAHKIKLSVDGYTGSETLTNFPVLVRVSESGIPGFHYADMSATNIYGRTYGYDLAFFAEDGTRLPCEIDTWNHKAGKNASTQLVWVALSQMTQGTKFYMCYSVADGVYVTNANPWAEYVGVWHLNETNNASAYGTYPNSTLVTGIDGEKANRSLAGESGVLGKSVCIAKNESNWNPSDSQIVYGGVFVPDSGDNGPLDLGSSFTISGWFKYNLNKTYRYDKLFFKRTKADNKSGQKGSFAIQMNQKDSNSSDVCVYGTGNDSGSKASLNGTVFNKWAYITFAYNGATGKCTVYANGSSCGEVPFTAIVDNNQPLCFGNNVAGIGDGVGENAWNGWIDEVRLSAGPASADWVKADYDTVNNQDFIVAVPPDTLTVAWATGAGTPGVSEATYNSVVFAGEVQNLGDTASSCAIESKVWPTSGSEPENWTSLTNGLELSDTFEVAVAGLESSTAYSYKLQAVGNDNAETNSVSGTFTTTSNLAIDWSSDAGVTGFSRVSYDYAILGGTVTALGGATSCTIKGKVWASGESEPTEWTNISESLAQGAVFSSTMSDLTAGTAYSYKLCAVGDDGRETEISGSFTTKGGEGETIGSAYTHFFDDGTNVCWVANGFERYLPFTVVGYTGTETLMNFPVLVDIRKKDTNGFTYDDFYHYDGSDMAFVDEKGQIIPHEIDTWNKSGMSLIWVRLPEMNNGTRFTMCYRSPLIDPLPDPGNTFERYVGVWHMNETQNGVVALKDSTTNNLSGEAHANSLSTANSFSRIGGHCRQVAQEAGTSSSNGRILVANREGDLVRTGVGNVFTCSGWFKTADSTPKWAYLFDRKLDDISRGWGVQFQESKSNELRVWADPEGVKGNFQTFAVTGYAHKKWAYFTFVFSNDTFHAFLNGNELASTVGGFQLRNSVANDETATIDHFLIGGQQVGTGAFNGWVEEVRYSKGIRSDDWIKAEYDSMLQMDDMNGKFARKGAQVSRGTESLVPVVVWERGSNLPDTIVDLSYAYVQFAGTVTFCGQGADECRIEYIIWADGEEPPETWTTLLDHAVAGQSFSIPVTGLKQDMPYNFRIRAVNKVGGKEQANREHTGSFRTHGNVDSSAIEGELLRIDNRFVHRYRAGSYTFTTPDYVTNVEILVVAGGGGGGYKVGGGGGGGGLFYSPSYPVESNATYRIVVGQGGVGGSNLTEKATNGGISYFALLGDEDTPLIRMHGGGAGGTYADNQALASGSIGASGGGGTYAFAGGDPANMGLPEELRPYGTAGGRGNDFLTGGSSGKTAAGGGGGAGRAGLQASFDSWYGGGAGGVGVENSMTGETLHYGAGGGGGYKYKATEPNYTKPGTGGSGIGGNAANLRTGTLATSGVDNTGAGGGGGSMTDNASEEESFWKGGDGGDGVVLIAYEVHGRDPVADEPRISMTRCDYTDETKYADIGYRAYWAGLQAQSNDIYIAYSTVGSEDLASGGGERVKVAEGSIGIGSAHFTPPSVGYTYWVRLMARKDANSYMYSDEIASFYVPAIRNNGANWHMPVAETNAYDYATAYYNLYDPDSEARLFLYWSENYADLEGDVAPSGSSVHFLDFGTGRQSATEVTIPASEGLERNRTYYTRFATGNEAGTKFFLSPRIMVLDTIDRPRVIFPEATWSGNKATAKFVVTAASLDPSTVEVLAFYSGKTGEVSGNTIAADSPTVNVVSLGTCADYPNNILISKDFPLWSFVATNYYVRLALRTQEGVLYPSQRYQSLELNGIRDTDLLVFVDARAKAGCYGDEPKTLDYTVSYGGLTNGTGWTHYTNSIGLAPGGALSCEVTSASPSGYYDITRGTVDLKDEGETLVIPAVIDEETGETISEAEYYYYQLVFCGAKYVVTNAQFTVSIDDFETTYTGEVCDISQLGKSEVGVRNGQLVTYQYRIGTNDWASTLDASYTDVGTRTVQFTASAPNHDDVYGSFKVTIAPAPLTATISTPDLSYTGNAQTPVVTTNVTGLVHGEINPLVCEFRDEAGEWMEGVPPFTQPGEYSIYFRVSASNHMTFVTNCTFTIVGWDYPVNMDGTAGIENSLQIHVSDPGWLLRNTGLTGVDFSVQNKRYEYLNAIQPNGLKLWQNYVIDQTNMSKKLVATIMQRGSRVNGGAFVVHFPDVEALQNTGLSVRYRLDRKLKGESEFTQGALTDKYEFNVPLDPDDPTGLYVFNMVFVPTNETYSSQQAVLASVATVGVLRVSSAMTNTVLAVPWRSMSVDSEEAVDVSASDVVNPNGISEDDLILAYNAAKTNFNAWAHGADNGWKEVATVSKRGVEVESAESPRFPHGKAFWLVRSDPGSTNSVNYIYLIGRYTGEDYEVELAGGTANAPGHTLVANPTMHDIALTNLVFVGGAPAVGDRIVFQNEAGLQTIYSRNAGNTTWGRNVLTKVTEKGRTKMKQVWTVDGTVPVGTGFWYKRTGDAPLSIKFEAEK